MALTNHYVASDGTDTWANSVSSSTPCSLATALSNAAAGDVVNIKSGTYSRTTTADAATNSGTAISPIVWRGVNTSWNAIANSPYRTNGNGALDVTGFPVISYSTGNWNFGSRNYHIFDSLVFSSSSGTSAAARIFDIGSYCVARRISLTNPSTNSAACGVRFSDYSIVIDCDFNLSGASGGYGCIHFYGTGCRAISCRAIQTQANCVYLEGVLGTIYGCVLANAPSGKAGIYDSAGSTSQTIVVINNTIYGCATGIYLGNSSLTRPQCIVNNHITDCTYAMDCGYDATNHVSAFLANNRLRNNSSGIRGFDDWVSATSFSHVTTGSSVAEDFVDYSTSDFRLIGPAVGKGAGVFPYLDIGALQHKNLDRPEAMIFGS